MNRQVLLGVGISLLVFCGGVIVVLMHGQSDEVGSTVPLLSFSTSKEEYATVKESYVQLVKETDPRIAIERLEEDSEKSAVISSVCHDLLHAIGKEALQKYERIDVALEYHVDFCNSGYLHGVFESYFEITPDPLSSMHMVCASGGPLTRVFDIWQCHHGLGHGLMYYTNGALDEALLLCGTLSKEGKASCQNGVYMEVFNAEVLHGERDIVAKDPLLVCAQATVAKVDCYTYIATYWSSVQHIPFADMFALCKEVEDGYEVVCAAGVGSEAMKRNMLSPQLVFELCGEVANTTYREMCINGVVSMYMNQKGSYQSGVELCALAPANMSTSCEERVALKEAFFAPVDL